MPGQYKQDDWQVDDGTYGGDNDRFPEVIIDRIRKSYAAQGWAISWAEVQNDHKTMGPGCGIGKGWLKVILELDEKLAYLDSLYQIHQIKEKFGGLRFYFDTKQVGQVRDKMYDLVNEAEHKCEHLCEVCGEEGTIEGLRWLSCRCPQHKV